MDYKNTAQALSYQSRENALAKNRQGWLDLFAEDAVVMDPVGVSPLDPTGEGQKGKEAIAIFFDNIIANANMDFSIEKSIPAGNQVANLVLVTHKLEGGVTLDMDMMVVYEANDAGLIQSLKAYWDFDELMQRMSAAMSGS